MKKCFCKLLFVALLMIIGINIVNASVEKCGDSYFLKETTMTDDAKYKGYFPICQRKATPYEWAKIDSGDGYIGGIYGGDEEFWHNYNEVITVGRIWQKIYVIENADAKGYAKKQAPLCSDSSAMIWSTTKCDWTEWKPKECKGCNYDCPTESNPNKRCHSDCCTKECPSGFSAASNGMCKKVHIKGYTFVSENPLEYLTLTEVNPEETVIGIATGKCLKEKGKDAECKCYKEDISYAFMCPHYECDVKKEMVNICTPTFEDGDGNAVYCINPSQHFTADYTKKGEFIKDGDFNVKKCQSSFATLDCGFANILIEAEYLKKNGINVSDKTVELALRLWSWHNGQQGFEKMSVANKSFNTETGYCDKNVYFMKYEGEYKNPYVETYEYLVKYILEDSTSKLNKANLEEILLTIKEKWNLFEITCNDKYLGVACGTSASKNYSPDHYQLALALVANTILGNDYMQTHLNDLFGEEEISIEIKSTKLVRDMNQKLTDKGEDKNNQYVEVIYEDLERVLEEYSIKNEKILCTEENFKKYPKIKPYCQLEIQIVDYNGNVIKDPSGKPLIQSGKAASYCTKNYCRFLTISFAICDEYYKKYAPIKVVTKRDRPISVDSITKYIACSNPADNQVMYGFNYNKEEEIPGGGVYPNPKTKKITDEFTLSDYQCQGVCNHYYPRENINQNCKDEFGEYDKVYSSSIKDPSLRCILHMDDSSSKNLYDYSEEFGLHGTTLNDDGKSTISKNSINNKMCKIYCSDEVEYHLADKVREKAGTYFRFDIEDQVRDERNVKYLFSNIITMKRTCVSEIYYKNIPFMDDYDWKAIYDLGNSEIDKKIGRDDGLTDETINAINNWSLLFSALSTKARSEGIRNENLNKLLYDLMNCNLYTDEQIKAQGVTKPQDDKVGNIRDLIMKHFTIENNYGIGTNNYGVKIRKGKYPDTEYCDIKYEKDSKTGKVKAITDNECIKMHSIDYRYGRNDHSMTYVDMNSITTNRNTFSNITYCTGSECFDWEEEMFDLKDNLGEKSEYNYPKYSKSKTKKISYPARKGKNKKEFVEKEIEIPTNDYAMFQIQTDVAFYNDSRFTVDPRGESYKQTEEELKKTNNLILEKYRFPVSKNAYNYNECTDRTFLNPKNNDELVKLGYPIARRCEINQNYSTINTYFRKDLSDIFTTDVKKTKEFKCYVDVEKVSPNGGTHDTRDSVLYRNIDPESVFPSSKDGYSDIFKSNWNTLLGRNKTDEIKKSANELKTTENYLEYRITLTPDNILKIREYNKDQVKYVEEEQRSCERKDMDTDDREEIEDPDEVLQKDIFINCKSPFLEELRGGTTEYGTIDLEFNGLQEKRKD